MAKKKNTSYGIVYSTDPGYDYNEEISEQQNSLPESEQKIRILLDSKHRSGKVVTIVEGLIATDTDLESIGKKLKTYCGSGGSVKDKLVIIQGDHREKIVQWCIKNGFTKAKKI